MQRQWSLPLVIGCVVATVAIGGCGSSSSSSSTSKATSGSSSGANTAAASAAIAPYLKGPTHFPVDTPLKTRPPSSLKLGQPQDATPTGALWSGLIEHAAKLAGVHIVTVKTGLTAAQTQSAMSSIIATKPNAVILPAGEPSLFLQALKTMHQQGIVVTSTGIMYPKKYYIGASTFDQRMALRAGQIMADWVIARHGASAKAVFYNIPELSFSTIEEQGFEAEMKRNCPTCTVRVQPISATTIGSTAPSAVVSDLQSNTSTNVAVFGSIEAASGLPAALESAGLHVSIIGFGSDPVTLQYLRNGQINAVVTFDIAEASYETVDEAFRLFEHQPLNAAENSGIAPLALLEQKTVPANISSGYSAFPNYAQQFAKLWKVAP